MWFRRHEFPFAVIGGLALHAYGISRVTFDLDLITVRESQGGVIDLLEGLGYETLHKSVGFSNHQHSDPEWGRLDLLYVDGATGTKLFGETECRELFEGVQIEVPRPEHLIALKLHAMHNDPDRSIQELGDIRFLLNLPGVDQEEVGELFEKRGRRELYERLREAT
ncbi:MAG: nucleotidyltransferase [Deltaproteobacteria bacterium]|nr:nucleotidyltransferase [Deltaproteobacteria bacterium]